MRAATSAVLLAAAAGFVAAQDDVVLTTTVSQEAETTTVYEPLPEESGNTATVTLTASVSWDTVTVSQEAETTTAWYTPEPEETDTITVIPGETTTYVRYWPELSYWTTVTTTFYTSAPPNATSPVEPGEPVPTAAAGRTSVGSSLAALVGFAVAGVLML